MLCVVMMMHMVSFELYTNKSKHMLFFVLTDMHFILSVQLKQLLQSAGAGEMM